jgi:hypothetical protein
MNAVSVLMLHAELPEKYHQFVQLFTTQQKLDTYLTNHPEVKKIEVTLHELDQA